MTPEEELHKAVWQILAEIRQEQLATPNYLAKTQTSTIIIAEL
jgi:hypothetical protein